MTEFNLALTIVGAVVLILGLVAGYVKNRLWMAETTICTFVGVVVGPQLLHLMVPGEMGWSESPHLLELARLTLGIAAMGAALRLPVGFLRHAWRDLVIVLGPGLLLMWLTGAALAMAIPGLALLPALLLGAVLAPTDPVVAASVTEGQLAHRHLPAPARNLLTAESGANDGLGMLFVMLPILLLTMPPDAALADWVFRVLMWEIGAALALGALCGIAAGRILLWAYCQPFSESHSTVTVGLALSITVLAAVRLIGSDGILAVFAAGLMLNRYLDRVETRHEHVQAAIGRFFDLPVFVVFGLMLPWRDWIELGWPAPAFAAAVLVLRRLPWWWLLGRWLKSVPGRDDLALLGWFGPIGVASIYYAILSEDRTGLSEIWPLASLVVLFSVLIHGLTVTPLVRRRAPPEDAPADEQDLPA